MDEPLTDRIIANVILTLNGIKATAGYYADREAERDYRTTRPRPGLLTVTAETSPVGEVMKGENGALDRMMRLMIHAYTIQSETIDENEMSIDLANARAAADVQRAVMQDIRRGYLAHDTWLGEVQPFEDVTGDPMQGIDVEVFIAYRVSRLDPRVQRY